VLGVRPQKKARRPPPSGFLRFGFGIFIVLR